MKKLITLLFAVLLTTAVFAEESVLIKSDVSANLEEYDFVSNFEITSDSGWFTKDKLVILQPNEKGFRFMAKDVPEYSPSNYKIIPAYPVFLNEADIGAGYISNAAAIKSIKVVFTTNRPYDNISVLYSTSVNGPTKEIKMPQDFNSIKSMVETELFFENPLYEPDVKKREVKELPVLNNSDDGIYFKGIKITTNPATGMAAYSEYSVIYIKEVSVVYDKMFTDEQLEQKAVLREEFGIDEKSDIKKKAITQIEERNRVRASQESLMHKDESADAK